MEVGGGERGEGGRAVRGREDGERGAWGRGEDGGWGAGEEGSEGGVWGGERGGLNLK